MVVGISTNLFVGGGVWYARVSLRRKSAILGCLMRTLCKFCVFVSSIHCWCFEGKFHSLAVLYCLP